MEFANSSYFSVVLDKEAGLWRTLMVLTQVVPDEDGDPDQRVAMLQFANDDYDEVLATAIYQRNVYLDAIDHDLSNDVTGEYLIDLSLYDEDYNLLEE